MASIRRIAAAALLIVPAATSYAPSSRAADPTLADCLSASEGSITLRKDHHLREARQQLLVCAALQCPAEVRSECERHLVGVNSQIPTLVFEAKDPAGNDLSAVTVTMDGKPLADRLEGTAISLDPGAHSFHFETAGNAPIDKSFVLREGEKDRRERIVFAAAGVAAAPPGGAGTVAPVTAPEGNGGASPAGEVDKGSAPSSWGPLKTVGVVVGGVGIVGIGIGAAFGLMAVSDKSNANCDAAGYCNAGSLSDAHSHANVLTVGFVAGGVLLAAGVGLVVFGPKGAAGSVQVAPAVAAGSGGVVLGGAF